MISTATYPNPHHLSTCPNSEVFYTYPSNMSIAWTYRTPSVHFLAEFGQVNGRGHLAGRVKTPMHETLNEKDSGPLCGQFAESANLEQAINANLRGLGYGSRE